MPVMRAMVLERPGTALVMRERPVPLPGPGEILVEIAACGVCRTDLHVVDGELPDPRYPVVPGHEIVGNVAATGEGVGGVCPGGGGGRRGRGRRRICSRRARRRAVARRDLRGVPLLPCRP